MALWYNTDGGIGIKTAGTAFYQKNFASGIQHLIKNQVITGIFQYTVIDDMIGVLYNEPLWLCTSKTPSGGHSLLAKQYDSGTNKILIYDTAYMQSHWVYDSSVFSASGFTLSWRGSTIFKVWGAIYI